MAGIRLIVQHLLVVDLLDIDAGPLDGEDQFDEFRFLLAHFLQFHLHYACGFPQLIVVELIGRFT